MASLVSPKSPTTPMSPVSPSMTVSSPSMSPQKGGAHRLAPDPTPQEFLAHAEELFKNADADGSGKCLRQQCHTVLHIPRPHNHSRPNLRSTR